MIAELISSGELKHHAGTKLIGRRHTPRHVIQEARDDDECNPKGKQGEGSARLDVLILKAVAEEPRKSNKTMSSLNDWQLWAQHLSRKSKQGVSIWHTNMTGHGKGDFQMVETWRVFEETSQRARASNKPPDSDDQDQDRNQHAKGSLSSARRLS
ncbi:hypothetical protein K443DRAFT_11493 [Laccaria amethystina LaAM-08-1]|uniref:Uncharacterized protein n=1 Tax=Laccaria amethystina LaAM-08-1 TaxID=1095629 RepID=A0A0C9XC12_9AGAR|nr:hypothetical protein K443DRAFT_11493 [Laccaria amethystina LaAM-08-1]